MFNYQLWVQWFQSLDRPFLFLLILPFVVAVVALWSELAIEKRQARGPRLNAAIRVEWISPRAPRIP